MKKENLLVTVGILSLSAIAISAELPVVPARVPLFNVDNLITLYRKNEVNADLAYRGNWVAVQGRIEAIKRNAVGKAFIRMSSGEANLVRCFFDKESEASLRNLKPTWSVRVMGICEGKQILGTKYIRSLSAVGFRPDGGLHRMYRNHSIDMIAIDFTHCKILYAIPPKKNTAPTVGSGSTRIAH